MKFELISMDNYESIKNHLFIRTVNYEWSREWVEECVYEKFLDLAFVPYVLLADEPNFMAARVTKAMLKTWGITADAVIEYAKANGCMKFPKKIEGLAAIIAELGNFEPEDAPKGALTVVTNKKSYNGATALFYPTVLEQLYKTLGNFYALPSSIHEWILLADNGNTDPDMLASMVYDINRSEVAPEERLSDHVYYYNGTRFVIIA